MNCQFCEDYEWSKKHRPKTGRELYTKYYVCLYERTLRKGCGLTSTQKTAAELLPGVRPPVEENKKGG